MFEILLGDIRILRGRNSEVRFLLDKQDNIHLRLQRIIFTMHVNNGSNLGVKARKNFSCNPVRHIIDRFMRLQESYTCRFRAVYIANSSRRSRVTVDTLPDAKVIPVIKLQRQLSAESSVLFRYFYQKLLSDTSVTRTCYQILIKIY